MVVTYFARNKEINFLFTDSEKIYRKLIESVKCGVYMADEEGNLFFVNQAFVEMLGYSFKEEVLGLNLTKELYVNSAEQQAFLEKMEKEGCVRDYVIRNFRKDRSIVILSATSNFIFNEQGRVIGVEGVVLDITEKTRLKEQLAKERQKIQAILDFDEKLNRIRKFDRLIDFIVAKAAQILEAEKCSLMILDRENKELCIQGAKGLDEEFIKTARVKLGEPIAGVVAQEKKSFLVKNIEYQKTWPRANRAAYKTPSFLSVPIQLEDHVLGVLNVADKNSPDGTIFDESDLKILEDLVRETAVAIENMKLYKELHYLTVTDSLTHLYNYRYFIQALEYEMGRARRFQSALGLLMLDIDHFRDCNEAYAHQEGSGLLGEAARAIQTHVRAVDIAARYAGDEFAVILPGTDAKGLQTAAERLRGLIGQWKFKKPVTLSIGAAVYKPAMSRQDFVSAADQALYQAKQKGRNQVCGCF